MSKFHKCAQYQPSKIWKVLNKSIDDIVKNQDLKEKTLRCLIVCSLIEGLKKYTPNKGKTQFTKSISSEKSHAYVELKKSKTWKILDREITSLVKNQDLEEITPRYLIVGYLCKSLKKNNLLIE